MTLRIRLDGGDPLGLVRDLEHRILIGVKMHESGSLGGNNADLDIRIGQSAGVVGEPYGDEVAFAPILNQSLGGIVIVFQSPGDLSP